MGVFSDLRQRLLSHPGRGWETGRGAVSSVVAKPIMKLSRTGHETVAKLRQNRPRVPLLNFASTRASASKGVCFKDTPSWLQPDFTAVISRHIGALLVRASTDYSRPAKRFGDSGGPNDSEVADLQQRRGLLIREPIRQCVTWFPRSDGSSVNLGRTGVKGRLADVAGHSG